MYLLHVQLQGLHVYIKNIPLLNLTVKPEITKQYSMKGLAQI